MLAGCYDLARNPPTYDFVTFLLRLEGERLRLGEDSVAIDILNGPNGGFRRDGLWPPTDEERRDLVNNIVLPMASLLPSCSRVTMHDVRPQAFPGAYGFNAYMIPFSHFVMALGSGIRPLRAKKTSTTNQKTITMTLREAEHWPFRNSNVNEWRKAALTLKARGYDVVVVRDTCHADEPLEGVATSPLASRNLIARAELYQNSLLNLFVSNGPAWMALAMDAPAMIFRPTAATGPHFFRSIGIAQGTQMPRSPPHQRLVWAQDTADKIVDECLFELGRNERPEEVVEVPATAGRKIAVVIGGAECVWADWERVKALAENSGVAIETFVINDMIGHFPEAIDNAVTLHVDKLAKEWLPMRVGKPGVACTWAHRRHKDAQKTSTDWGGSSGLYAIKIARECGHTKIILCGVPMSSEDKHFVRHENWKAAANFKPAWERRKREIAPYVRSFSGWTAQTFGSPTSGWIENGHQAQVGLEQKAGRVVEPVA